MVEVTPALFVGIVRPVPPRITPPPGRPPYQNSYWGVRVVCPFPFTVLPVGVRTMHSKT